jgi:hypothetical protein
VGLDWVKIADCGSRMSFGSVEEGHEGSTDSAAVIIDKRRMRGQQGVPNGGCSSRSMRLSSWLLAIKSGSLPRLVSGEYLVLQSEWFRWNGRSVGAGVACLTRYKLRRETWEFVLW